MGNAKKLSWVLKVVMLLALVGAMGISPLPARAEEQAQFGIRPANSDPTSSTGGYFTLKASAGEALQNAVIVANAGNIPVKLKLYPVDATTAQTSGAVYLNQEQTRQNVGSWLALETDTVELPPKSQTTVNFKITVPKGVLTGQHLGGIVAQLLDSNSSPDGTPAAGGFGIKTITRAVTAVLVNVGSGDYKPSLTIRGAEIAQVDGLPTLTLDLNNDGQRLYKPSGEVKVTDSTGKAVLEAKLALDNLVPWTSIAYPVQVDPPSQPGTYHVHVSLDFGGAAPAIYDGDFVIQQTAVPVAASAPRSRLASPVAGAPNTGVTSTQAPEQKVEESFPTILLVVIVVCICIPVGFLLGRRKQPEQR